MMENPMSTDYGNEAGETAIRAGYENEGTGIEGLLSGKNCRKKEMNLDRNLLLL